jgi:hypothetical protein
MKGNLIEANSRLTKAKIQLANFNNIILHFTNFVTAPICCLIKAKETPTFQHFFHVFHGGMDAPNEDFRGFVINLYTDNCKGGPTKSLSMLDLLEQFDTEYNPINNLGHWAHKKDPQLIALPVSLQNLQGQLTSH